MPAQALKHITFKELDLILKELKLSEETRLTVAFEDPDISWKAVRRQKALDTMKILRGSGNEGGLVEALLQARKTDQWQ